MKSFHILLVEDNEGDILIATEAMEEIENVKKISIAKDGESAITFLQNRFNAGYTDLPNLILLDINLPKKSGYEVLEFIKNSTELKHIPVIMLSTTSNQADIKRAYRHHANCFITKPYDIVDYFKIMNTIGTFWLSMVKLTIN